MISLERIALTTRSGSMVFAYSVTRSGSMAFVYSSVMSAACVYPYGPGIIFKADAYCSRGD